MLLLSGDGSDTGGGEPFWNSVSRFEVAGVSPPTPLPVWQA